MTEQFDRAISAEQTRLEEIRTEMRSVRQEIFTSFANFLHEWYPTQARKIIEEEADVTLSLGKQDLSKLKSDIAELSSSTTMIVEKHLGAPRLWWDLDESVGERTRTGSEPYWMASERMPEFIEPAFRFAMGHLATLLEKKGYLKPKSFGGGRSYGHWRQSDSPGSYADGSKPYYPEYHFSWPPEILDLVRAYHVQHQEAVKVSRQLRRHEEDKRKYLAAKKWDGA